MNRRLKYISFIFFAVLLLAAAPVHAQQAEALIRKGNRYYKAQDFDQSRASYEEALKKSPGNANANFNLGNAEFRKNDFEKAASGYDEVLQANPDLRTKESAYYNKGVAMLRQKKLEESIESWKQALQLDPNDQEARDNLIRALREKQQQQQQNNNQDKKEKKPKEDKQKQKEQEKNQEDNHPKPQQSKLSKQQVDQYLRSLIQREKDVQDKMNQNKTHAPDQPEKDW